VEPADASIEEYKSLRQESLAATDRQQRVVAGGTALAGVVLGIGASATKGASLSVVLLLIVAPVLASLIIVIWLGEVERMVLVDLYTSILERQINVDLSAAKPPALGWQTYLRQRAPRGRRTLYEYRAVAAVLFVIAGASAAVGVSSLSRHGALPAIAAGSIVGIWLALVACFYVGSELRLRVMTGRPQPKGRVPIVVRIAGGYPRPLHQPVDLSAGPPTRAPQQWE